MQPLREGKRRQTLPDVHAALDAAIDRGGDPEAVFLACQAYYRLPASTKDGGEFAMGAARLLERDRWREFNDAAPGAGAPSVFAIIPKFPNAAIRAYVAERKGEAWAVSYLDTCAYAEEDGRRTITAPNTFIAGKLKDGVPELEQRGIRITVQTANPSARSAA